MEQQKTKFELIQMEKNYQTNKSLFVRNRTIFVVGRNKKYGKKIFFINDFYPRFLVEEEENIEFIVSQYNNQLQHSDKVKEIKREETDKEHNFRNLGGEKKLVCIYTYTTQDVVDIRDSFAKTYEANIKFTEVLKRAKLIKGYFYVPEYILETGKRFYHIDGVEYIMLFEKEIEGGDLIF